MGSTPEEIEAALQVADSRWREHILSEGPQHKVVLTKPIYFGVTEVTQSQYEQVMGANRCQFIEIAAQRREQTRDDAGRPAPPGAPGPRSRARVEQGPAAAGERITPQIPIS